jgi:hypothetical protein
VRNPCVVKTVCQRSLTHEQNVMQNLYLWLQSFIKLYMDGMISQLEVTQMQTITEPNLPCLRQSIRHGNSVNIPMWALLHCTHNVFSKLWLLTFFVHSSEKSTLPQTYLYILDSVSTTWISCQCSTAAALPFELQKPYTTSTSAHSSFVHVKCISNNSSSQQNTTTPTKTYKWKQN